jgi:hypothetical protein
MNNHISDEILEEGASYVASYTRVKLTPNQLRDLIHNTRVEKFVRKYKGFDTSEREEVMDLLANKLLGLDWPCNMDSGNPEYEDFYPKLLTKAIAADYTIIK